MNELRAWLHSSTSRFLALVDALDDADWERPSALPGWRTREIVAHVHLNAEALGRLVTWADTGVVNPMYPTPGQRDSEIRRDAEMHPEDLRRAVHSSALALDVAFDALPDAAWNALVTTAQGRSITAREIPWLRTREVAVHAVDLDPDTGFDQLPEALNLALVREIVDLRIERGEGAALAGRLTGRGRDEALSPWL